MDFSWRSMGDYLRRYEDGGIALNVIQLVGHGTLRIAAMGFARRPPTAREQAHMQRLMDESMGAVPRARHRAHLRPGLVAATEEIVGHRPARGGARGFLCQPHPRGGRDAARCCPRGHTGGREGGLPVQVSHIKAAGRTNGGRVPEALALIDAARAEGLDVRADVYPYTASSTTLRTLLPDWALEGGIETMLRGSPIPRRGSGSAASWRQWPREPHARDRRGRTSWWRTAPRGRTRRAGVCRRSRPLRKDPLDAAIELIVSEQGKGYMILFQLDETDLRQALVHPHVMIGSDGSSLAPYGELAEGKPHPRSYGTFPRVLGRYARDSGVLGLARRCGR